VYVEGAPEKVEASPAGDKPKAAPSTNGKAAPAAKGANGAPLGTPQILAASIADAARNSKFDRSTYETVRSLDRFKHWIARASDLGVVALDTETNSLDPMVAELCGFSLSVGPNMTPAILTA
jgi:DNA polymerase-1